MFSHCNTAFEAKSLFRKLALKLHPDYGGSNELMILLTETYENALKNIANKSHKAYNQQHVYEKTYEDIPQDDSRLNILNEIAHYAVTHPKFKCDYLVSVVAFLEANHYITSQQFNALINIYYGFKINLYSNKPNN